MSSTPSPPQGTAQQQISSPAEGGQSSQVYRGRPPGAFIPGGSWKTWLKLFKNFLTLQQITDENSSKLILLQEVGQTNYELLESLLQGKSPEDASMAEICDKFEKHFQPKKLLMAERYNLLGMQQRPGQSLGEYWANVQKNANNCAFDKVKDFRDVQVTMVFVGGISSVEIRKRLLEKEDLSSKEALELAEAYERVGNSAPTLKEGSNPVGISQVQREYRAPRHQGGKSTRRKSTYDKSNYRKSHRSPTQRRHNNNNNKGCYSCGSKHHTRNNCPARATAKCTRCKKAGHLENVCRMKSFNKVNYIENDTDSDMESISGVQLVNSIKSEGLFDEKIRKDKKLPAPLPEGDAVVAKKLPAPLPEGDAVVAKKLPASLPEGDAVVAKKLPAPLPEGDAVVAKKLPAPLPEGDAVEAKKLPAPLPEGDAVEANNQFLMKYDMINTNDVRIVNKIKAEPPAMLDIQLNNVPISMELDTGASMSIINGEAWEKLGKPILTKAETKAAACNNSEIHFTGKFLAKVKLESQEAIIEIHVMNKMVRSLLGRDLIRALKIDCGPHFKQINAIQLTQEEIQIKLTHTLNENKELFYPGLGECKTVKATFKFKNEVAEPKFCRARPVPYALRPKVEEKLNEMIEKGILKQVEHSEWATPLVVVPKPGGKIRICGDYKITVNPQLDINQYPLPIPEDLFHQLNGGEKFSKMDLSDAYMQVVLEEACKKVTTINTHKGLYEYQRIPFGVASAPAIFQRIMEQTLGGIEGVLIYLDDITVTGPDDHTHMERLAKVLSRLKEAGFRLKREKCEFFKERMEFLGHVVDKEGIRPSPEKVKAMLNMPEPKNVKEIESFIGMVQYYGKFIPNLSTLAAPINKLRRKDTEFTWGIEQKTAFQSIKKRLTDADVLAHYNPKVPVILATDASNYGLGAVIYHKYADGSEKVIAYSSRTLTKAEKNYAQIEKEALGIVYGVEKYNQFLYGRKFTLLTDHQPLVTIFGPKAGVPVVAAKRLHRWALKLMAYSFDIEYRNTNEFGNADGLSRLPDPRELPSSEQVINEVEIVKLTNEVLENMPLTEEEVRRATSEDEVLQKVIKFTREGWPANIRDEVFKPYSVKKEAMSIHKGILLWESRVVIPSIFKTKVLKMLHSNHYGKNKMLTLARQKVWYPKMDTDIAKMAKSCETCALHANDPNRVMLHPWEEPEKPWQRLHMDFCESREGSRWLVIVDAKSKWPEVIKMQSTTTEKMIEKLRSVFATHGLPEQVMADNGPQFASKEFKTYCTKRNIELTLTPAYHPNSNGEAERFVQTFKQGLYKGLTVTKNVQDIANELLFQYRVTPHAATQKSPAEILMGRRLRTTLDIVKTEKGTTPPNDYRKKMSENYPGKSKLRQFTTGQEVYIRNYNGKGEKWLAGIVAEKVSSTSYIVHYGTGQREVHVDQMKPKVTFQDSDLWVTLPKTKKDEIPKKITVNAPTSSNKKICPAGTNVSTRSSTRASAKEAKDRIKNWANYGKRNINHIHWVDSSHSPCEIANISISNSPFPRGLVSQETSHRKKKEEKRQAKYAIKEGLIRTNPSDTMDRTNMSAQAAISDEGLKTIIAAAVAEALAAQIGQQTAVTGGIAHGTMPHAAPPNYQQLPQINNMVAELLQGQQSTATSNQPIRLLYECGNPFRGKSSYRGAGRRGKRGFHGPSRIQPYNRPYPSGRYGYQEGMATQPRKILEANVATTDTVSEGTQNAASDNIAAESVTKKTASGDQN